MGLELSGLRLGLGQRGVGGAQWTPIDLFASGEAGAWFPITDGTQIAGRMYKSATTGGAPAVSGDTVAVLIGHEKEDPYGAEQVVNGGFDTDTIWSKGTGWTISGGKAVGTAVASYQAITQGAVGTVGTFVKVSYETTISSGTLSASVGNLAAGQTDSSLASVLFHGVVTTHGTVRIEARSGPFNGTVDNVSCKIATAGHAIQTSASLRPTIKQHASGAWYLDFDGVDDVLTVKDVAAGTYTVAYKSPAGAATYLESQSLSGDYNLPAVDMTQILIINRALTASEKTQYENFS